MWSENCVISPGGFLHSIQRIARIKDAAVFTGFQQNDVGEFLQFIIDCFHNSIKREVKMTISGSIVTSQDKMAVKCYEMMKNMYKKEYSEMLELFYGIHVSVVKSLDSEYENISPEPFFNLQLELPNNNNNPTIMECIEKYTQKEILDDDLLIESENKKNQERCTKEINFWSLPRVLIITLKRFNNKNKKDQRMVNFEHNLDMTQYVKGYKEETQLYELYGICNHSGGTRGGHYTSFVKNANNKWYLFNDTKVTEIKNEDKLNTTQAYCFFYRKK
jgi:ubiquitin C-terminal hydrolase